MTIARVQKAGAQTSSASASLPVTLPAPPTVGNLLIAAAGSDATIAVPTGFTLAVSAVVAAAAYIWYRVVQVGDSATVTFVPSVSDAVAAGVLEYSGLTATPLDAVASNPSTFGGTSIATGTTGTIAQANELVIAAAAPHSVGAPWTLASWTAGYTSQITEGNALGLDNAGCFIADRIEAGIQTEAASATFTGSFSNASAVIATFKGVNLPAQQDLDWRAYRPVRAWSGAAAARSWLSGKPTR